MNINDILCCEKATQNCDKAQYSECTFWNKIKLNLHLVICGACRKYTKNNSKLTKLCKQKLVKLEPKAKQELETTFNKELAKHNN